MIFPISQILTNKFDVLVKKEFTKEEHALKNVNSCWNTTISFYLETTGGQNYNLYLNVVQFLNTSANETSVAA